MGKVYEVFISFRGPDTRSSVTSYLADRLQANGIDAFLDTEEIDKGKKVWSEIKEAIHGSKIFIPIFSDDYASSKWCLDELVEIVDRARRSKSSSNSILPIFYKFEPRHVRHQTGSYEKAFQDHKGKFDQSRIQKWKEALKFCAELSGYESDKIENKNEAELVLRVVKAVKKLLKSEYLILPDILIGAEEYKKDILRLIDNHPSSNDKKMVVLVGMGGVGKSTLAKAIYNDLCDDFEACASLINIREKLEGKVDISRLQNQLLTAFAKGHEKLKSDDARTRYTQQNFQKIKVLLLLDDINNESQLELLGGNVKYFGPGSRIIVTSRDRNHFKGLDDIYFYQVGVLNKDLRLRLFSKHAFGLDKPRDPFLELSTKITEKTGGLPLAIKVIATSLCQEEKDVWEAKLKDLEKTPPQQVLNILRVSYDPLTIEQKQMFLDIAYFFIGEDKAVAFCLWEALDLNPKARMEELRQKCLVDISGDKAIDMHHHLRDMGRNIVNLEENSHGDSTRRWTVIRTEDEQKMDARYRSSTSYTSKAFTYVKSCLNVPENEVVRSEVMTATDFDRRPNLVFLQLNRSTFSGNFRTCQIKLRWLDWVNAPQEFTATDFNPYKLVILRIRQSPIKDVWAGWQQLKGAECSLKVLNLSKCSKLTTTPKLSMFPNLERLIVTGCEKLLEIDPSVGGLSKLVFINIEDNAELRKLPIELNRLDKLEEFILHRCPLIQMVPIHDKFLEHLGFLSAPCCKTTSIQDMATPEGLRFTLGYIRENLPINKFKISFRGLQDLRKKSQSYKRWSKTYPEQALKEKKRLEELCKSLESKTYKDPKKSFMWRPPCRIAILDRHFLCFYCKRHPPHRSVMCVMNISIWAAPTYVRYKAWCSC